MMRLIGESTGTAGMGFGFGAIFFAGLFFFAMGLLRFR